MQVWHQVVSKKKKKQRKNKEKLHNTLLFYSIKQNKIISVVKLSIMPNR